MSTFVHSKVEPNRLSTTAGNIEENLRLLENAFRAVDEALSVTLKQSWSGVASTNFFTQYEKDREVFASHVRSISNINDQLREASGIFNNADNRALDIVRTLNV